MWNSPAPTITQFIAQRLIIKAPEDCRIADLKVTVVRSMTAVVGSRKFKLRHYRKTPAKAIAAAPERPASGNAMCSARRRPLPSLRGPAVEPLGV
jgi:hypothetical protein